MGAKTLYSGSSDIRFMLDHIAKKYYFTPHLSFSHRFIKLLGEETPIGKEAYNQAISQLKK